jgi:hypothetical protein
MDVIIRIIWGVVLDNPVNFWKVKSTLGYIRAKQNTSFGLAKFEVGGGPFLLLLFTVDVLDGNIDVVEEIGVELHCIARRHEDHYLFLHVLAKESEQELELSCWVNNYIALFKGYVSAGGRFFGDLNQYWVFKTKSTEIFNFFCHGGAEEASDSCLIWQKLDDFVHLFFEPDFQNCISFINDQHLQIMEHKTLSILKVI